MPTRCVAPVVDGKSSFTGTSVVLTLDEKIQYIAEKELDQAIHDTQAISALYLKPIVKSFNEAMGGHVVVDTTRALYVWEVRYYPQFYIPLEDVSADVLKDDDHAQHVHRGCGLGRDRRLIR